MKQELELVSAVPTVTASSTTSGIEAAAVWAPTQAYHELADVPVREIDLFESIESQLAQIEEMQQRMRFMVREVKYLLKA